MHLARLLVAASVAQQANALGGFDAPPTQYRPKFRYWLPDASVTSESLRKDVAEIASINGGGLQFLPFYNYGLGPALTDWSLYGFGTPAYVDLLGAALDESAAHDLRLDVAFGPNQGAGVPSEAASPGLARELVYGNTTIQSGESYHGDVPPPVLEFNQLTGFMGALEYWGENELMAVVAGKVLAESLLAEYFYLSVLDESSLVDLTNLTTKGKLDWTAPAGNGTWVIFGIYERYTHQRECVPADDAASWLVNGSWKVDHFSATGAQKVTDFWDDHILSDATVSSLIPTAGEYAWEDSIEMQAALWWTPGFASKFEEFHGYSVIKYLPLLFNAAVNWNGYLPPYNVTYTVGGYPTDGGPYVEDYKTALTQGYKDYIAHFDEWALSHSLQYSDQPAYNLPLDMTAAIPIVQIPELESLGFGNSVAAYRQFTGAAHLANSNVISTEVGAVLGGAYKLRVPELRALIDGSLSAGVNTFTIHGYAYSGEYVGTVWPGYTPFQYEYTEMWNQRQPAWKYMDELMLYVARNTMVQKSGIPKIDLAFYYLEIGFAMGASAYPAAGMNAVGYTYEYLGPENLVTEQAVVKDGVLAPDGPAFQALVIYNQTWMTANASEALVTFAEAGLPIYIVGTIPNTTYGATGQDEVSSNFEKLLGLESVHVLTTDEFSAQLLADDGLVPRASVNAGEADATGLYTFWTSDAEDGQTFVTINNAGPAGAFNMTFQAANGSVPSVLDAWTGKQTAVAVYERVRGGIRIPVTLNHNQTTILAFSTPTSSAGSASTAHAVGHSANIHAIHQVSDGHLEAWVSNDGNDAWVEMGDGSRKSISAASNNGSQTTLGPWKLSVEAHGPSPNNDTLEGSTTTIDVGTLPTLAPWTQIPGLENASGVGTYVTTFSAAAAAVNGSTATTISFGPVLNTLKAWINGVKVPAVDPANPVVDVTGLVTSATNELRVEVSSSLFNAVKANIDRVYSIGYGPQTKSYYTDADWEEFGLIGPVTLQVYRRVALRT